MKTKVLLWRDALSSAHRGPLRHNWTLQNSQAGCWHQWSLTPRWRLNKAWIRELHARWVGTRAHTPARPASAQSFAETLTRTPRVWRPRVPGSLTPFLAPAVSSVCLFFESSLPLRVIGGRVAPVSSPGVTRALGSLSEPRHPWTAGPGSGLAPDSSRLLGKQAPFIVLPSWHVEQDNKRLLFFSPGSSHIRCPPYTGAS